MKERNGMEIYVLVSIRNKSRITDNLNIFNIKKSTLIPTSIKPIYFHEG